MGNIGDSRAIMGSKDSNDLMVAIQLTVDLKPDLPSVSYEIIIHPLCLSLFFFILLLTYSNFDVIIFL